MSLQSNPELELASDYVRNTRKHLFLTGKAGSGKTTFLHQIKQQRIKRMAVVAPTGVAAINAGGMTIHSLFQLPIGLHLPGVDRKESGARMRAEKIRLIRSLDLLVIDEISMVRADLLDAVDQVLQRMRGSSEPFGGVQLLMIGDLHQLPPVVKPEEWQLLGKYYDTPFFFGSHALKRTDYVSIELKHIYRQADPEFVNLLNKVRDNRLDNEALQKLNSRYVPGFEPQQEESYITLTATNAAASEINDQSLNLLPGQRQRFEASLTGEFPASSFPTEQVLEFKVGAQVMFIRNDTTSAKSYFNGKLGRITSIDKDGIRVRCDDQTDPILVQPAEWQNMRYSLNEQTKQIEEQILGTFSQYPLRLAWAITIHKSQGLTFERCIIDAQAAFASGQVYVALSRCKSFEGIVLRSYIRFYSVKTDPEVKRFSEETERNLPTEDQLWQAKRDCQTDALRNLFRFDTIADSVSALKALCLDHANTVLPETSTQCQGLEARVAADLVQVSQKFAPRLEQYLNEPSLPEENGALQERLKKASVYFSEKLQGLAPEVGKLGLLTDNRTVGAQFSKIADALALNVALKQASFAVCQGGFAAEDVSRAQVNAELDFRHKRVPGDAAGERIPKGVRHPELYRQLLEWRESTARRLGLQTYEVAPNQSLREIVHYLPIDENRLSQIPKLGRERMRRYGQALLDMIRKYRIEHQVTEDIAPEPIAARASGGERSKGNGLSTHQISYDLYRTGKGVDAIAAERRLVKSTVLSHLMHFVESGELPVLELIEAHKLEEIQPYFITHPASTLTEARAHFNERFQFHELRLALAHLASQKTESESKSSAE